MAVVMISSMCGCTNKENDSNLSIVNVEKEQDFGAYQLWNFEGTEDGFHTVGQNILETKEEGVIFKQDSEDGGLQSPGALSISADVVQTVEIRLKTEDATKLKMQWRWPNSGYVGENQVQIELKNDGKYHDYQIQLSTTEGWKQVVEQMMFSVNKGTTIELDSIRLTGLYLVPFPWLTFSLSRDLALLNEIKNSFGNENNSVLLGFSYVLEYMKEKNSGGKTLDESIEYMLELSNTSGMPVVLWLRADPWGEMTSGVGKELYADDNNLMWTEELTEKPAYRNETTGYYNMCLAQTDLEGNETEYWKTSDELLGKCAEKVQQVIEENPGQILGVTTTSEYRFVTEDNKYYLDYNPRTVSEFLEYCKTLYPTIEILNDEMGTQFATYELRSEDYNPSTVENKDGFDAPRDDNSSVEFWTLWKNFRASQIHAAVSRLVNTIGEHLDEKYIYTHQIAYNDDLTASPISCGNVEGSNIGIDFFNHEANDTNLSAIQKMIGTDVSRAWGCPEWMITIGQTYDRSYTALDNMIKAGAKYICPFNYGGEGDYDIKGTESEKAISDYIKQLEEKVDALMSSKVTTKGKIADAEKLVDGLDTSVSETKGVKKGDSITFELREKVRMSSLTFKPAANKNLFVGEIKIYANGNLLGTCNLGADKDQPITVAFNEMEISKIKIEIVKPVQNSKGENVFAVASIKAGNYKAETDAITKAPTLKDVVASGDEIKLSWSAVKGENVTYHVEISTSDKFRNATHLYSASNSISINAPKKSKDYYYRVWAVNSSGCMVSTTNLLK